MATLREVADKAGVSMPVVSAYLRGSKTVRMSEDTRRRVAAAIDEVGYVPNLAARSLRTSRTNVIAVVVPKLDNPALAEMLRGIYDAAQELGYVVMLGDAARLTSGSQMLEHLLAHGTVDGVIVRRSSSLDTRVLADMAERGLPVLFLDDESLHDFTWLALDDAAGIRLATSHLIDLGHVQIDFLGGLDPIPAAEFTRIRYEGYVAALKERGLAPRPPIMSGQAPEDGYEAFSSLVAPRVAHRRKDAPTALVVNNVTTATGVLAAAYDAGISVPGELSVVGYLDTAAASMARPRLTTVRMPMYELGHRGVAALSEIVKGEHVRSAVLADIAPTLIRRDSTAPPAGHTAGQK